MPAAKQTYQKKIIIKNKKREGGREFVNGMPNKLIKQNHTK